MRRRHHVLGSAQQDYREEQWTDERGVSCSSLELCNTPFRSVSICAQYCVLNNAPTNKDLSSMKHASTVGGAFRAGAVSTLLPGSYGALVCENASRDT